jgi:signal transduction histidine kinase
LLGGITIAIATSGADSPSGLRHLYLLPTVWAALSAGARGGGLIGLIAGLLQAPFTLPAMERLGLGAQSVDGLVSMATPLAFGCVVGGLVDRSRARARRLQAVLDLARGLGRDIPLQERLDSATEQIRALLSAESVGLVIGPADARLTASAPGGRRFAEESAAGWTLREGQAVVVADLHRDPRFTTPHVAGPTPVRGLVLPLDSGTGPFGALAVERAGGLPPAVRAAAEEMALHLALAVENARLGARQRRFTEELAEKVAAATERLRELDQAKTEFVSVVAHELRTPLTALQGFTELLLSRAVPPERAARFLSHLHSEAERLGRIVAELLDLSRIESGRSLDLEREPVDLAELFERNIELFATQHPRHRFQCAHHPGAATLHADRDAVDRILNNLIANAVKYSPDGGRVLIAATPSVDRPGMIELSVKDEGVGIPAGDVSRIFDRYVRVPNRETAAVRGLGLGLALVRALAEAHGGGVQVESSPGKGSTFRVFLPAWNSLSANFPNSSP